MLRRLSSFLLVVIAVLSGCKDDGGGGPVAGVSGGGAGAAGVAGLTGGAGVPGGGTGGTTAGSGGMAGSPAGGTGGAGMGAMPTYAPTWSAVYSEVITQTGCNGGSTCHASIVGGNLVMNNKEAAYAALVNVAAMGMTIVGSGANCKDSGLMRVVPSQPDMSLLVKKIEATDTASSPCGEPMPLVPPRLMPMQIMQIRNWIMMGAMNN